MPIISRLAALISRRENKRITVYGMGKRYDVPRSSVYHYDRSPGNLPISKLYEMATDAGLTAEECGRLLYDVMRKREVKKAKGGS